MSVNRWRDALALFAAFVLAAPAPAAEPDAIDWIPAPVMSQLRASGLIGSAGRIQPFRWTTVTTRPLRSPRRYRETYAGTPPGAPAGLSPMVREELTDDGEVRRTVRRVSARGLVQLKPGRKEPGLHVQGLRLPPVKGARFRLEYDDGSGNLVEDCVVGDERAASTVHPAIPGRATQIDCSGTGRYLRLPVRVDATVLYLHEPGVFVNVDEEINGPIGRLQSGTRIIDFAMGTR